MNSPLQNLNKAFENRVRLGIMSVLQVNEFATFIMLKELLKLTDGNLASHLKALEKTAYIEVHKEFIDRKPNTKYKCTKQGKTAFELHLNALEAFLKGRNE